MNKSTDIFKSNYINNFVLLIYIVFPFAIVSGPAIPDILISITSIIIFFYLIYNYKRSNLLENKLSLLLLFFWIYLIFSSSISEFKFFSLKSSLLYLRFLFFLFIIFIIINNKKIIKYHFIIFSFLLFFLFFDAGLQFMTGSNILNFKIISNRASSFFLDELILGNFIYTFYPLVFFFIFRKYKKYSTTTFVIFSISLIIPILFTGERISLIKSLILIFILGLFVVNLRYYFFLFLILMSFLFSIISLQPKLKDRFFDDFKSRITFNNDRNFFDSHWGGIYLTSFELFKQKYIFGIGPNNYRNKCDLNDIKKFKDYTDIGKLKYENEVSYINLKRGKNLDLLFKNNLSVKERNNYLLKNIYEKIIKNKKNYKTIFYLIDKNIYVEGYYDYQNYLPYNYINQRIFDNYISFDEYNKTINIDSDSWSLACSTHPHHFSLQLLTEIGIIGFILVIILAYYFIRYMYNEKNSENYIFIIIGMVYVFNTFNPFLTYANLFNNNTNIFIWFFIVELLIIINFYKINNEYSKSE